MAGSVNKVILIGHLGAGPEIKSFQNGGKIANLRIATSESWKDRNSGERQTRTEWHSVVISGDGLVGVAEKYLRKGSSVYVEGSLRTRKWQDRDGNDRYSTEVVLSGPRAVLTLLDKREGGGNQSGDGWGGEYGHTKPQGQQGGGDAGGWADGDLDDDVPFVTPYPVRKRGVI